MSRRWWLLAGLVGLCCLGAEPETPKKPGPTRWLSEWEQGRAAARERQADFRRLPLRALTGLQ